MDDRQLQERGNQLEEEFFRKQNAAILDKMREAKAVEEERQQMAAAIGVDDPVLIDQLHAHGVTSATLAAVSLAPLVLVAWADRTLEDKEREAVLKEAGKNGVAPGTPGYELLQGWLREKPDITLLTAWTAYARAVVESLEGVQRQEFRDSILNRAKAVANAAGGFAGMGKVSDREKDVLTQIEAALS
jgi:hypothetical protein